VAGRPARSARPCHSMSRSAEQSSRVHKFGAEHATITPCAHVSFSYIRCRVRAGSSNGRRAMLTPAAAAPSCCPCWSAALGSCRLWRGTGATCGTSVSGYNTCVSARRRLAVLAQHACGIRCFDEAAGDIVPSLTVETLSCRRTVCRTLGMCLRFSRYCLPLRPFRAG